MAAGYEMAEYLDGELFDVENPLHVTEYARAKWKYSGGTDLAALEALKRPKFKSTN